MIDRIGDDADEECHPMQMTLQEEQRIAAIEARVERLEESVGAAMIVISELLDRPEKVLGRLRMRTADPHGCARCKPS
jgi:hypothetical protein